MLILRAYRAVLYLSRIWSVAFRPIATRGLPSIMLTIILPPPTTSGTTSLPPPILTTFYRGTIESVLTSCITVWYGNCCAADRKTLQRTVNTAAKIIGAPLPSILDIFLTRCSSKAKSIVEDPTHPSHSLFQLLPSGRRYRSIRARSARLLNSFFPQAVRALNSHHTAPL